ERWYEARMVRARPDEVLTIIRDITTVKHNERRFTSLVQDIDAIVWEGRADDFAFDFVSDRAEAILGFPTARWYEPGFWRSRLHPEDREHVLRESIEAAERGEDHRLEYRVLSADDRVVWVRDVVRVLPDGLCRGLMVDITERKELDAERRRIREQLAASQKLESMGLLAGGIAHDFNNLLTAIVGNASLLSLRLPEDSPHRRFVEEIELAADRATALTRQILAYAGKASFELRRIDVGATVREIAPLLRTSMSSAIGLALEIDENLPAVQADAPQLQQLVMNLALNAAEAFEGRPGRVRITAREAIVDAKLANGFDVGSGMEPGRCVRVEVIDAGHGMSSTDLARALDPFFTTKPAGRGLGLSVVAGIVRSHGAGLRITSSPGSGSTFAIYLRAADAPADATARTALTELEGSGTILVVDDEPALRTFARESLTSYGYEVVLAPDGRAGLERFQQLRDRIALVVMDMTMPVMTGEECLREMRRIDPDVRVLLVSGYDEESASQRIEAEGLAGFLQKPFTATRLAAKVRELLRDQSGGGATVSVSGTPGP
ncbi:MAG: response regulator, partial [Myxococcales bacterium]|nr:response regulator [Myxococcales bacterium]